MKQMHIFTIFETPKSFYDGQFGYLVDQGNEILLISSDDEDVKDFVEKNHIRFVPVQMPRALSLVAILRAIRQIIKLVRKEKPDAVFGHTPVGALCAMIAAKWCKVKHRVYYRHGLIYTTMKGLKRTVFKMEERFVSALATDIINVSPSLSKLAVCDGLNAESKQHVIGHGTCGGIDAVNQFNPQLMESESLRQKAEYLGIANADIVFGFCGRICNDKGISELVAAFELFQKKYPDLLSKLVLIGSFDIRDSLSVQKRNQIETTKDIVVTGRIDKSEMPSYYALLDVFVFPSHREGFGMSVVEASAMEKPILVSRSHGCVDSIIEYETGEYIDLSAEGILKGMERMLQEDIRRNLGKNGRCRVLEWYDHRVMWPLVKELYERISG